MFYCTVNVSKGKIDHIYTIDKYYDECIHVAYMLQFNWTAGFRINGKYYKRQPGLPMVIAVGTDNESEVKDLVFSGKYIVVQEYEYTTFA